MVIFHSYVSLPEGMYYMVGGWAYPSGKYDFVSWDDDIPNIMKKVMFQTTNQYMYFWSSLFLGQTHV